MRKMSKVDSVFHSVWQEVTVIWITNAPNPFPALMVGKKASGIPQSLWDILNNSNTLHHPAAICSQNQRNRFLSVQGVNAIQYQLWSKSGRLILGLLGDHVLVITWKCLPRGFELSNRTIAWQGYGDKKKAHKIVWNDIYVSKTHVIIKKLSGLKGAIYAK